MGRAALAWLLVPLAGALAIGAVTYAHPRLHHGARLSLSDHHGRASLELGQARPARARFLAVSLRQIRTALGARPVQAADQSAGSARPQSLTRYGCRPRGRRDRLSKPTTARGVSASAIAARALGQNCG